MALVSLPSKSVSKFLNAWTRPCHLRRIMLAGMLSTACIILEKGKTAMKMLGEEHVQGQQKGVLSPSRNPRTGPSGSGLMRYSRYSGTASPSKP